MAIAIDASSPAVVRVATGACTTASFTAPANALLLALYTINNTGTATDTVTDSGGLTWTKAIQRNGDGTRLNAAIWWAVTTSSTARTVSVNIGTSANHRILKVEVLTGTHLTAPIGATTTGGRTTSGTVSQSITSTASGSMAWMSYSDGGGGAFPTGAAGTTVINGDFTVETMAVMYQTAASTAVSQTMTIADTAPSTASSCWAVVEVVPPAAVTGQTFNATGTWVCPAGVTSTKVECWGGGGAGGNATGNPAEGGGGAGGAYARCDYVGVDPGTTYTVIVGATTGANTLSVNPLNGGASLFYLTPATIQSLSTNMQSVETDGTDWTAATNMTVTRDSTHASSGTWAIKGVTTVTQASISRIEASTPTFPVYPGAVHDLSVKIYGGQASTTCRIEVDWYANTAFGNYISSSTGSDVAVANGSFTTVTASVTPPAGARSGNILIAMRGTYAIGATIWCDEFSWISPNPIVLASGGAGGSPATTNSSNGAGGTGITSDCTGSTLFAGGNGAAGTFAASLTGGAGGGGAGDAGAGGNASGNTGGTAGSAGGGAGSAGVADSTNGTAGTAPGGGGSGGDANSVTDQSGGAGAAGRVVLTYNTGPDNYFLDMF